MNPAWVVAAVSLATIVAGVTAWALRWAWRIGKRIWDFTDDYFGQPGEHGKAAVPGVMERLESLEANVAVITAEVHENNGKSLRDTVTRIEQTVNSLHREGGQP